jgi:hypothetical protein
MNIRKHNIEEYQSHQAPVDLEEESKYHQAPAWTSEGTIRHHGVDLERKTQSTASAAAWTPRAESKSTIGSSTIKRLWCSWERNKR